MGWSPHSGGEYTVFYELLRTYLKPIFQIDIYGGVRSSRHRNYGFFLLSHIIRRWWILWVHLPNEGTPPET